MADQVLQQGVQGITDLINMPALINLDFADVVTVMQDKGIAHIGVGTGKGETKCLDAVQQAITSPLLETSIDGASHVIINVSGDIGLLEANEAATYVQEMTGEDANIIFGAMMDAEHTDTVTITVIATGLHNVGGSASKLKSRLENPARSSAMPHAAGAHPAGTHAQSYERPVHQTASQASPRLDFGTVGKENAGSAAVRRPVGGTTPTLDTPRTPTSKVKEQSIKIPDFFKK